VCKITHTMEIRPRGPVAARLRQRKFRHLNGLTLPPDGLPGSLARTHRRCGKPTCRCASGEGHPVWSLTFMLDGKKHVERIPDAWVADVRRQVEAGRAFKDAVAEVFAANAQLLALWRRQQTGRRPR
jgi:hypothetical protein